LTDKPVIFVVNVSNSLESSTIGILKDEGMDVIPMDIKLEYEISTLETDEKAEYLKEFELDGTGLDRLAKVCYEVLGLISFFTSGEQESRAWTIKKGATAQDAAGTIHTDFAKNFIAAEVVSYQDFVDCGGWVGAKSAGKVRLEGRDYVVQDGEVFFFKHN
jgi:ribosome-binding ATPase